MFEERKKHPKFKVIFLKQMPPRQTIYPSLQSNEDITRKISASPSSQQNKTNEKSLARLSSLIQDQNEHLKDIELSNISLNQPITFTTQVDDASSRIIRFRQTNKHNGRYLSELLMRTNEKEMFHPHKTGSINKLISDRKIQPIDRLKVGKKNISFSVSNKKDLAKDFDDFVSSRYIKQCNSQSSSESHSITILPKRHIPQRKLYSHKANINQRKKARKRIGVSKESYSPVKDHKKYQEQEGLAVYFRRLAVNIPHIKDFGWSKVLDRPYDNLSYTRQV